MILPTTHALPARDMFSVTSRSPFTLPEQARFLAVMLPLTMLFSVTTTSPTDWTSPVTHQSLSITVLAVMLPTTLDFTVTTHVFIDPDRPDEWNSIFQEMMSKPVDVVSPELGGRFTAIVIIKPEREKLNALKLTISVKEVPDSKSLIPGEEFSVPTTRKVKSKKGSSKSNTKNKSTTCDFIVKIEDNFKINIEINLLVRYNSSIT